LRWLSGQLLWRCMVTKVVEAKWCGQQMQQCAVMHGVEAKRCEQQMQQCAVLHMEGAPDKIEWLDVSNTCLIGTCMDMAGGW